MRIRAIPTRTRPVCLARGVFPLKNQYLPRSEKWNQPAQLKDRICTTSAEPRSAPSTAAIPTEGVIRPVEAKPAVRTATAVELCSRIASIKPNVADLTLRLSACCSARRIFEPYALSIPDCTNLTDQISRIAAATRFRISRIMSYRRLIGRHGVRRFDDA